MRSAIFAFPSAVANALKETMYFETVTKDFNKLIKERMKTIQEEKEMNEKRKETKDLIVGNIKMLITDADKNFKELGKYAKGFEQWAKDFAIVMNNLVEELSELTDEQKKSERKEPEEGQSVFYLLFDGEIDNVKYRHAIFYFAWRTRQLFLTHQEAEDYKRFLLIEAQIREIAERVDEGAKYYLRNVCNFEKIIQQDYTGLEYADFLFRVESEISADDLKFYFEYER